MTTSPRPIPGIIRSNDPPPFTAPNARSRAGTLVHRTTWHREHGNWLAYPVCHVDTGNVRPGDRTRDHVTCSRCQTRLNLPPQSKATLWIIELRLQLWHTITESIADLGTATTMVNLRGLREPAAKTTYLKVVDIHRQLRSLVGQCTGHGTFEAACLYIADYRHALLEILQEEPPEHRNAA